jgi:mannose-6-phosphate isomerase-like protein (cupin superfamily)
MHITKDDSTKKEYSPDCVVWEYEIPTEHVSIATAYINGRFPVNGKALNLRSEQIYYVVSGTGSIHTEKGVTSINEADVFYFEKGEPYWMEGKQLKIAIINSPAWSPQQYEAC